MVCAAGPADVDYETILHRSGATWWSAVPAIHQELVRAQQRGGQTPDGIRVIRSGSAQLPPRLRLHLETVFGAEVLETYGLTETAGPVATERVVDGARVPGMRLVRDTRAAVIEAGDGQPAPAGVGELVLHGPAVAPGVSEYADGQGTEWFQTGDRVELGKDGRLVITGRLKDAITRGGEQISLQPIEAALLRHPDVLEAAAFGAPHPTLGETVAAAVVLAEASTTTHGQLIDFVQTTLTPSELPRAIVALNALPRNEIGKLDRASLATRLQTSRTQATENGLSLEHTSLLTASVTAIMAQALEHTDFGLDDDFFACGGDSLAAVGVLAQIARVLGVELPLAETLSGRLTVNRIVDVIGELSGAQTQPTDAEPILLVPVQPLGSRPPMFMVFSSESSLLSLRGFPRQMGPDQPVIGLLIPQRGGNFVRSSSVTEMAQELARRIEAHYPTGPLYLTGHSFGGLVAHELACQLLAAGREVVSVILLDTRIGSAVAEHHAPRHMLRAAARRPLPAVATAVEVARVRLSWWTGGRDPRLSPFDQRGAIALASEHRERFLPTRLFVIGARDRFGAPLGWNGSHAAEVTQLTVPGDHLTMLQEPNLGSLVSLLTKVLSEVEQSIPESARYLAHSSR